MSETPAMNILRVDAAKMRRLWQIMEAELPAGEAGPAAEARALVRDMLGIDEGEEPGGEFAPPGTRQIANQQHAVGEDGYQ